MAEVTIENIVSVAKIADSIDLQKSATILNVGVREHFPGILYESKEPKAATLIFKNGLIVTTGPKSMEEVRAVLKEVFNLLKKGGVETVDKLEAKVKNIVASYDIGQKLDLSEVAGRLTKGKVKYNPKEFPGIIYQVTNPTCTLLIFESGKVGITGPKKIEDAEKAVDILLNQLAE